MIRSFDRRRRFALRGTVLLAILSALGTGCSLNKSEPVAGAPPGTTVVKLTGLRPAWTPPDPRTASPSVLELEGSLRRIVVRYVRFTEFFQTDPQALLSDKQIEQYAQILARELPTLSDTQRIRFKFNDRYFGSRYNVEMDVYREGTLLVYWFNALAGNIGGVSSSFGGAPLSLGRLQQGPGQEIANRDTYAYLKDPLLGFEREAAAALALKKQLLDDARKDGIFSPDEAVRLDTLVARERPSVEAWKDFWEKRRTLKKALDQGLIDRGIYQTQLDRLYADLER